jgi:hypothetical protein
VGCKRETEATETSESRRSEGARVGRGYYPTRGSAVGASSLSKGQLCAGDRDPGPTSGRSLAGGSPHQPSGSPPGRDSESGSRGSRCGACSCVRVFCATRGRDWEVPAEEPAYLQSCMPGQGHARSRPRALCPSPPWCQLRCLGLVVDSESEILSSSLRRPAEAECSVGAGGALGRDRKSVSWARCMPHARMLPSQRAHWQGTQRARAIGIGARSRCRPQVAALRSALQFGASPEAAPEPRTVRWRATTSTCSRVRPTSATECGLAAMIGSDVFL